MSGSESWSCIHWSSGETCMGFSGDVDAILAAAGAGRFMGMMLDAAN
jgi:hypothetical protein